MKVVFVGAGALGCTLGAVLHEGGCEVWLVDRNPPHVDTINAHGLRVVTEGPDGRSERTVPVRATTDIAEAGVADVVIVLVKAFATRAAVESALPAIGPDTVVLSLQNGIGQEEDIEAVVGRDRVLLGATYVGGQLLEPGRVSSGVQGKDTVVGALDPGTAGRAAEIARAFTAAGLETRAADDIMAVKWSKLLVNVATGALSTLTGLTYYDLYRVPEVVAAARAAIVEGLRIADRRGLVLELTEPEDIWELARAGLPAEFKTSMLRSVESRALTEIDYINGAVVTWGQRLGVPTPVNEVLVAGVKGVERRLEREKETTP